MKNQYISIIFIICLVLISGCKSDSSDPTPQDNQKKLLINDGLSWTLGTVTKDGLDVTDQFTGFKLTVGDFTYTTVNALPSAWPASGTWSFANEAGTLVDRNDGVQIAVTVTTTSLQLTFSVTGLGDGGRIKGVNGQYVFNLVAG
ncbi:MAG: hypothetical protein R2804_11195 [Cyclobacteriaceae bacterium]